MKRQSEPSVVGILGGMGPQASAEFVKTIYEYADGVHEQEFPRVVLLSDPSFPDRTDAFLRGDEAPLLQRMEEALGRLRDAGATRIVICCMTIHHLLPRLAPELRERVLSLPEIACQELIRKRQKHLLLCSTGTRQLGVLEKAAHWSQAMDYVVWPDERDQQRIHRDLIYPMKQKQPAWQELVSIAESLLEKYDVDSFLAACTEVHLLARQMRSLQRRPWGWIDPLDWLARGIAENRL